MIEKFLELIASQEFARALEFLRGATLQDALNAKARAKKDAERIEAFEKAAIAWLVGRILQAFEAVKAGDNLALGAAIAPVPQFAADIQNLHAAYANRAQSLSKFQFPKDLWSGKFKDPFKPERKEAERIAQVYGL